jgi:hypothetical protein
LRAPNQSQPSPRRRSAPGRLFSTITSACITSARARSRSAGCFKSSASERLPRLSDAKFSL